MKRIERSDILDPETYAAQRDEIRRRVNELRDGRRATLGPELIFLFETFETLRYQVHETLRADNKTSEEEIQREIDFHNAHLGGEGELGCTLLLQIEDAEQRDTKLREWLDLPQHLFLVIDVGQHVPAQFDARQIASDRLSSIQYVKFACGAKQPVALVCTRPGMELRVPLGDDVKAALAEDLGLEPSA